MDSVIEQLKMEFAACYADVLKRDTVHDPRDSGAQRLRALVAALRTQGVESVQSSSPGAVLTLSDLAMFRGTVVVMSGQMADLKKRYETLNKKAARFGIDPIKLGVPCEVLYVRMQEPVGRDGDKVLQYLVPYRKESPEHASMQQFRAYHVDLEFPVIKLGDWKVIAQLEAVRGGNLTYSLTQDADELAEIERRSACPIECEHCRTHRARTYAFVLRNPTTGEYKEVGKSCLKDFTGIDPSAALFLARMHEVISHDCDPFRDVGSPAP